VLIDKYPLQVTSSNQIVCIVFDLSKVTMVVPTFF